MTDLDGPRTELDDYELVEVWTELDEFGHEIARCRFGQITHPQFAYTPTGGLIRGQLESVPPVVILAPAEVLALRLGGHCLTIELARANGVKTYLDPAGLLVAVADNGTWKWRLFEATFRGQPGFMVGVWPD